MSAARKLTFFVSTLLIAYGLCEAVAYALIGLAGDSSGRALGLMEISARRRQLAELPVAQQRAGVIGASEHVVLHPFLGYVLDARTAHGVINPYGFRGEGPYFHSGPFDVTVLVTGGSGAEHLHAFSADVLRDEIARIPRFRGHRVHVVSAAVWLWKQPQQLLAVAYYLVQGGRIDILINLDGYNEVGNWANQRRYSGGTMYPAYPSPGLWEALTADIGDPQALATAGEVTLLRKLRKRLAQLFEGVGWSVTASAFWLQLDRALDARISDRLSAQARAETDRGEQGLPWFRTGPTQVVPPAEVLEFSSQLWLNGSRQLAKLAEGNGAAYFHFLQPTILLEGTKPLSAAERRLLGADPEHDPNAVYARRGYPRLRELGAQLRAEGVAFHDLTRVFADVEETLYVDNCCHFAERGNALLARRIAALIAEHFEALDAR